ncbi:MAG: hypothetical protein HY475_01865 [Candidatus Terrybacteria bacterium]|nr:hypothetical protein [Candidatus Terrybacteria bacterium]
MLDLMGIEGEEILVLYSRLVYRWVRRRWKVVGRMDRQGQVVYLSEGEPEQLR